MTNQEIYDLIARFENSSLHTMKLSIGDFSIELNKGSAASSCVTPTEAFVPVSHPPKADNEGFAIVAPLVGTYYASPTPGKKPFVAIGDKVRKGQTVCLIEAMKMISEIPAPCDCIITEVLKTDGSLAAYNEPIFRYQPC